MKSANLSMISIECQHTHWILNICQKYGMESFVSDQFREGLVMSYAINLVKQITLDNLEKHSSVA